MVESAFGVGGSGTSVFIGCDTMCPACGAIIQMPDTTTFEQDGIRFYIQRSIDAIRKSASPIEAAQQAIDTLQAVQADPTEENLANAATTPGLEWLAELLPGDRKEKREDVKWAVDKIIQVLAIVVACLGVWVALQRKLPPNTRDAEFRKEMEKLIRETTSAQVIQSAPQVSYLVSGTEESSGFQTCVVLSADSESDARQMAQQRGILVQSVIPGF